ncbi:MAG: DUF4339 domain-containing protein [Verrucomicrobia bacterium]|nr:DUF4339 domain-containing protein [Verrucomicrobiota bacterium]
MSTGDIWYFLRGQETVGPFSKEIMQQVYEGGQITPETLVWRDGMDGWKPASSVPELEIPKKAESKTPATSEASNEPASTDGGKPKLKLKLKESSPSPAPSTPGPSPVASPAVQVAPVASARETASPVAAPPQSAPVATPSAEPPKGLVAVPVDSDANAEEKKGDKKEGETPSAGKRILDRIFSALVLTPLFLIACGALIWFFQQRFPNAFWFVWMAAGFGAFGVLSLVGIRAVDGLFRGLAFLLLLPPIMVLWPVIMSEKSWQTTPPAQWAFLGFCFLYFLTTRIGLGIYITPASAKVSMTTGLLTLAFLLLVGKSLWEPPGWSDLVAQGNSIRLPPFFARAINKPEWASAVGLMQLGTGDGASKHDIEKATLKTDDKKEARLILQTVDGLVFEVKIAHEEGKFDPQKIIGQDCPIVFGKKSEDETGGDTGKEMTGAYWTMRNGNRVEVTAAQLKVESVKDDEWSGALTFDLKPDKNNPLKSTTGTLKTKVKGGVEKPGGAAKSASPKS